MISPLALLAAALKSPAPWLMPHLVAARDVVGRAESVSVAAALNAVVDAGGCDRLDGRRFIEQSALPAGEPYEAFIARTDLIPTRDNLHDLFNGLMWLRFPMAKRRLNQLQAAELAARGNGAERGPLRDALTVFDENAALLRAPSVLIEALRRRDWNTLFLGLRAHWAGAELVIFGHALLEKLMQPRKAITAHVWVVDSLADEALTASLDPARLAAKDFLPLPVLGVPEWWPENESPDFYDDADVFRRPRS